MRSLHALFIFLPLLACGSASGANNPDAGNDAIAPIGGQWIWDSNAPTGGATLTAVWASNANDAWAVGDNGVMLHWNGSAWSIATSGTSNHLASLWGSAANDVWAVAGGLGGPNTANLVHWDGNAWSPVDAGTPDNLKAIWGSGSKDIYAVGASGVEGTIQHYDGATWTTVLASNEISLAGVSGSGSSDIWAVGSPIYPTFGDHYIMHAASAASWIPKPSNVTQYLSSVWSASSSDAWAVGLGGMLHWNGQTWSVVTSGLPTSNGVWGLDAQHIWAIGAGETILEWNGSAWSTVHADALGPGLVAVGGSDTSHKWAVGADAILRFDAQSSSAPQCADVGGQCGDASACGTGHFSDYGCGGGATCCVSAKACGVESPCCDSGGNPGPRPICHDGVFYCPSPSQTCPMHP